MCGDDMKLDTIFDPIEKPIALQQPPFRYIKRSPTPNKTKFATGEKIMFAFEEIDYLDPSSVRIIFNASLDMRSIGGRTYCFSHDIRTVFSRIRLLYGNTCILEDLQEQGMYAQLMTRTSATIADMLGSDAMLRGLGTEVGTGSVQGTVNDRTNYHHIGNVADNKPNEVPKRYIIKLELGLFKQRKPIPIKYMRDKLRIELTINGSEDCAYSPNTSTNALFTAAVGTRAVQIGFPQILFKAYQPGTEYDDQVWSILKQSNLQYQFESYYYSRFNLNSYTKTQYLKVPTFKKRILRALAIIRCESDHNNYAIDSTQTYISLDPRFGVNAAGTAVLANVAARETALRRYQWFFGNTAYPERPVDAVELTNNDTSIGGSSTAAHFVDDYITDTAAESFYYMQQTTKAPDGLLIGLDYNWSIASSAGASTPSIMTRQGNTAEFARNYPCNYIMAAEFGGTGMDNRKYALDGASTNDSLQLRLDFNKSHGEASDFVLGTSSNVPPPMFVEVFVIYDNILTIDANNNVVLDN